jgi:alpha-beta hydrolase superfamily lysophospholipase
MHNEYREIKSFDGTMLRCLVRENGSSKWLVVSHGLGEHSGRHEYMLKLFSQSFNIAIYDLRGHGKSEGKRAWVEEFDHFSKDLQAVLDYLRAQFNLNQYSLFGHSMGGLLTANYMQNTTFPEGEYPEKVYLSSPAASAPGLMGPLFSHSPNIFYKSILKLPSVPLSGMLNLKKLSHDTRVYEAYVKDELCQLKIESQLFFEILKTGRNVFSRPLRIECPLFVSVGTGDVLVNPNIIEDYFTNVEKNAQLKIFEGGYHELHNEIDKFKKPYLNYLRQSLTGLSFE